MDFALSVEDLIGNTPVVRLDRFNDAGKDKFFAKCEFMNPGGSVKDRIALHMVRRAEEQGLLRPGSTIVEATAGNTGVGLAVVAALNGYKVVTVMSEKVSSDKVKFLQALGAETVITPSGKSLSDPEHAINRARAIAAERGAWFANQFWNEANVQAHYANTGPELWKQMDGHIDVFVAGVGTGGTLSGVGRFLKERNPDIKVVLADPLGSMLADLFSGAESVGSAYLVEGIGQDFVPGNLDVSVVDDVVRVSDVESIRAAQKLFQREGLFVGSSSGCIAAAATKYSAAADGGGRNIAFVLPDSGRGYVSTIYDAEWIGRRLGSL